MRHPFLRRMLVAVAAMSVVTTGCFGSFQMTRDVYSWNQKVGDNKWSKELVFLLIGPIVPVYGVAVFLDAVFVNSIEFWTGKNPMTSSINVTEKDGRKVVQRLQSDAKGRSEIIEVSTAAGPQSTTTLFQGTGSPLVTATTKFADGRIETRTVTVEQTREVVAALTRR